MEESRVNKFKDYRDSIANVEEPTLIVPEKETNISIKQSKESKNYDDLLKSLDNSDKQILFFNKCKKKRKIKNILYFLFLGVLLVTIAVCLILLWR